MVKMDIKRLFVIVVLLTSLFGCESNATEEKSIFIGNDEARINLKLGSTKKDQTANFSLIYGEITYMRNGAKIKKINLNCLGIQIAGLSSQKIYIDSVAHVLTNSYVIENAVTEISVYWKLDGLLEEDQIKQTWKPVLTDNCNHT